MRCRTWLAVVAGLAIAAPSALADDVVQIVARDSAPGDELGSAVAASGGTVVVGAPGHDQDAADAGTAYVFVSVRGFLLMQAELRPSDPLAGGRFGAAVAVSGDTIVVGAPGATSSGAVYVFERTCGVWTQSARFTSTDGAEFGTAVAIDGDMIVAGAPGRFQGRGVVRVYTRQATGWEFEAEVQGENIGGFGSSVAVRGERFVAGAPALGSSRGIAHVFGRSGTTWAREARLDPPDAVPDDRVGAAVAIADDRIVVGAPTTDLPGAGDAGVVHVYDRIAGAWTRTARLTSPIPIALTGFGGALALDTGTLVVGSPGAPPSDTGRTHVFTVGPNGWEPRAAHTAPDAQPADRFGFALAVSDGRVVVGAPSDAGAAYAFAVDSGPQKVSASDGEELQGFGISVAMDGDTALIGAWLDDDKAADAGSVYVFARKGGVWAEQQELTASDGGATDRFGWSVALEGDTALVGAYREDQKGTDAGAAYVFVRTDGVWSQQQKLTAGDGAISDEFGWSVALSGETAVVGAHFDNDGGTNSGSAYAFVRAGTVWTQQRKFLASDDATGDEFGSAVAVSGDTAIVGAQLDDATGTDSGSAYVFVRTGTTWSQQQKLTAAGGAASDFVGFSVALAGNTAFVGAPGDDDKGSASGSVHVYVRSGTTWTESPKLLASDGTAGAEFGHSVVLAGSAALVGAWVEDQLATDAGAVYVFAVAAGAWTELEKLTAGDGALDDRYGHAIALSGDTVLISAYRDDDKGDFSGTAWFRRVELPSPAERLTAPVGTTAELFAYRLAMSGDTVLVSAHAGVPGSADVFVRTPDGWTRQQELTAVGGASLDKFGFSVALSGDTAVVGAAADPEKGVQAGAVHVFVRAGGVWTHQQKLTASDGAAEHHFGYDVAIEGDTVLVGAEQYGVDADVDTGAVYVFERTGGTWIERQRLLTSDAAAGDRFGFSVALSGDTALVGAFADDDNGTNAGSAYFFVRSVGTWTQHQKVTASDGASSRWFGFDVALSGDAAFVGSVYDDDTGNGSGAAYVFVRRDGAWTAHQKLTPSDGVADDAFGAVVAISERTALIGAPQSDPRGLYSGAAYVFAWTGETWVERQKLVASDGQSVDQFGQSVALSRDRLVVGAPYADTAVTDAGAAYVFEEKGEPLDATIPSLPAESTIGVPLPSSASVVGGTPPYQWRTSAGALPGGVALDVRTGALSGTPNAAGDFAFTIEVCDASSETVSAAGAITVHPVPLIDPAPWPVAIVGRPYRRQLTVSGGTGAFTWTLDDGGSGLAIGATDGVVAGVPDTAGTFPYRVSGEDSVGAPATNEGDLRILDRLEVPTGKAKFGVAPDGAAHDRVLELLGGSALTVVAKAPRGFAAPTLELLRADAAQTPLDIAAALRTKPGAVQLRKYVVPSTGRFLLRVTPNATDPLAVVALAVTVAPPRSVKAALALVDGQTTPFVVPALAGSKVTVTIRAAKGQTVDPNVVSVKDADGADVAGTAKVSARRVVFTVASAPGGDLVFAVGTRDGTSGSASASAVAKPPKGYAFDLPGHAGD